MTEDKRDRLSRAKEAAEALRAALPPRPPTRKDRLILAMTPEEKARLASYAQETREPMAVAARNLILAALTTLGK